MNRKLILAAAAFVALAAPLAAQADPASTSVTINGDVAKACLIGQPTDVLLSLGDLTGPDGKLTAALTGTAPSASTTIETAWCNTPSTLSINASPMSLQNPPSYLTPAGFARLLTYDASLTGWTEDLLVRPVGRATTDDGSAANAYANALSLDISALGTLNSTGAEAPGLVLEAGSYTGTVVVSLAAQ